MLLICPVYLTLSATLGQGRRFAVGWRGGLGAEGNNRSAICGADSRPSAPSMAAIFLNMARVKVTGGRCMMIAFS